MKSGAIHRSLALLAAVLLGLTACAGGTEGETGQGTEAETPDGTEGGDQGDAPDEATLVYAVPAVADHVDPALWQGDPGRWSLWVQRSSLVRYDTSGLAENGCDALATVEDITGELAESWEFDEGESAWVVDLRDAQSPYGNTLSAEDVKWSYDRMKELSGVSRFMYQGQAQYTDDAVEVVDEDTIRINVQERTALDMAIHTIGPFTMGVYDSTEVKKHTTEDDPWAEEWLATNTANYGPWQLESINPGTELVYVPNENYWGDRGNITRLIIRGIPESSTRQQLIQAGEIDATTRLSFEENSSLQGVDGLYVADCVSPNRDDIVMNLTEPPFDDARVRQALALSIDREALVEGPYRGFGQPSRHSLPASFDDPSSDIEFEYDPERAQQLLAEAGYEDGLDATLTLSPSRPGPHAEEVAILIQDMAGEVGINFELEVIASASDFNTRFQENQYEAMLYLDPPAVADTAYTLNNYLHSEAAQNNFGYSNPDVDALIEQIATTQPGSERDDLIRQIDQIIMEDMPIVYLVDRSYVDVYRDSISGVTFPPHGELLPAFVTKQ